jgi:hypothetical protein
MARRVGAEGCAPDRMTDKAAAALVATHRVHQGCRTTQVSMTLENRHLRHAHFSHSVIEILAGGPAPPRIAAIPTARARIVRQPGAAVCLGRPELLG